MVILLMMAGVVLLIAFAGWLYQKIMERRDSLRYPPPGRLVDVGGYQIHLISYGERQPGQPTVVLESGDGLWSTCWNPVLPEIARFARVCAYDRPGFGWSESSPRPCTFQNIAEELHALLKNAGEQGPYILVGHSFGGMLIRQFASQFPEDVGGLVFVDAIHENFIRYLPDARKNVATFRRVLRLMRVLARFGFVRLLFRGLVLSRFASIFPRPEDQALAAALTLRPPYFRRLLAENIAGDEAMQRTLPDSVGSIPIIVVQAHYAEAPGRGFTPERWKIFRESWIAQGADLLRLSKSSQLVVFEGDHIVQNEHPELIVEAVRNVIRRCY